MIQWVNILMVGVFVLLLTVCPSKLNELEAVYYQDSYIRATILAADMIKDSTKKAIEQVF